jgi:hypothetical protein
MRNLLNIELWIGNIFSPSPTGTLSKLWGMADGRRSGLPLKEKTSWYSWVNLEPKYE